MCDRLQTKVFDSANHLLIESFSELTAQYDELYKGVFCDEMGWRLQRSGDAIVDLKRLEVGSSFYVFAFSPNTGLNGGLRIYRGYVPANHQQVQHLINEWNFRIDECAVLTGFCVAKGFRGRRFEFRDGSKSIADSLAETSIRFVGNSGVRFFFLITDFGPRVALFRRYGFRIACPAFVGGSPPRVGVAMCMELDNERDKMAQIGMFSEVEQKVLNGQTLGQFLRSGTTTT